MQIEYLLGEIGPDLGFSFADGYANRCIRRGQPSVTHPEYNSDMWFDATSDSYNYEKLKNATLGFCYTFEVTGNDGLNRVDNAVAIYNEYHQDKKK